MSRHTMEPRLHDDGRPAVLAVLFPDEPTTGLDPASRLTIWDELRRINGHGTTVFLTA